MSWLTAGAPRRIERQMHVRKTLTFDGGAGSGAIGSVTLFTTTGRVLVHTLTGFCTSDLLVGGVAGFTITGFSGSFTVAGVDADEWLDGDNGSGQAGVQWPINTNQPRVVNGDIVADISSFDITGGVLIFDAWYTPITDTGLLTGD